MAIFSLVGDDFFMEVILRRRWFSLPRPSTGLRPWWDCERGTSLENSDLGLKIRLFVRYEGT